MYKRKAEGGLHSSKKKTSGRFKEEWLSELIETSVVSSSNKQMVRLGDIFTYNAAGAVVCTICSNANTKSEFSTGKKWDEWKLDYLKRHLSQKVHIESVVKLRNMKSGGILRKLQESAEDRSVKLEIKKRKKSSSNMVKVLIDNVILAIKLNASILSVSSIHEHVAKYVEIPENWRSKNYAFEFVECISFVLKTELMTELRNSAFHTLIIDESTDISSQKMLIIYFKYRLETEIVFKTIFGGIVKLSECNSISIVTAVKRFYNENSLDLQKMVMFTSDGASVMLGKNNGVAAILKREIPHLYEQHCVAHREDLAIEDAWKELSFMQDIETLLRIVYTMFSRSSVKNEKFRELVNVSESDVVAFRPLHDVRWLSRHFAVAAFVRNYNVLIEYCTEQVNTCNDPINKYCLKRLLNPQFRLTLTVLNDVLGELASISKYFQRSGLTTIEAFQFAKAKMCKIRSQYLGETPHWTDAVKNVLNSIECDVDKTVILRFVELLCNHLEKRFPDDDLLDWQAFDHSAITRDSSFEFGKESLYKLIRRYSSVIPNCEENVISTICEQYNDFKFLIAEKVKTGSIQTFSDVISFVLKDEDMKMVSILLDICGTFQASSADCERGFSLMNSIKRNLEIG